MQPNDVHERLRRALAPAYAVERELPGGGMSRVFLADEVELGRTVVIKVLHPELTEGLSAERFKREVRVAARLQHPLIVPLLAAGALEGGILYYTMPLVEGESLRARLVREGALPVEDVVRITRDVARALAYAHRAGLVHRDIKPDNILLSDGGAVVADFGIAKAITASREEDSGDERRLTTTLTAAGTSLGTPAYIAPEQAAADAVDHRADLYSLGVVTYEMLAGRPPFEGRTAQQLLAAHATEPPEPIERRRRATPERLATLVMRLLEKSPADRPQSATDVLLELDAVDGHATSSGRIAPAPTGARGWRRRLTKPAYLAAAIAVLASGMLAAAAAVRWRSPAAADGSPVMAALTAPPGLELRPELGVALSPDARQVALVAADEQGVTGIWLRPLDSFTATRLAGTEGAVAPFWAPDGRAIGYFARGQLHVLDLSTQGRRTLCPSPRPGGAAWTPDGVIIYSPDFLAVPLHTVPAAGGPCRRLTAFDQSGDYIHRRPSVLPDGRRFIFSGSSFANTAYVGDVATGEYRVLRSPGTDAQFVAPHWLIFRDRSGGPLYVQRLDMRTIRPIGESTVALERVIGVTSIASYSAVPGALVALQADPRGLTLIWVDRSSTVIDSVRAPIDPDVAYFGAASGEPSHDGRRLAFAFGGPLWIYDRERNVATRARAETSPDQGILDPTWSPGDSLIAYRTIFRGALGLRVYRPDSDTSDSLFAVGRRNVRAPSWSPDGREIVFQLSAGDTVQRDEIWFYSLSERRAYHTWEARGNLSSPRWSPDRRWIAYVSDETGSTEVYVRRVDGSGAAVRASSAGGEFPRWRADGRELYYRAPNGAFMVVRSELGATAVLSPPAVAVASPPFSERVRSYSVSPDGRHFIAFRREDSPAYTLLVNWESALRR